MHQGQMYNYNQYRVMEEGLQVCNLSNTLIQQRRRKLIALEKEMMASRHCNVSTDSFLLQDYKVHKNFTVFLKLKN